MKAPDPCEPLEKLVDKLNEQLDALCSQSQEHLFLEGLIDLRGLTEATRAMLKDAEGRLADCRRHPCHHPIGHSWSRSLILTAHELSRRLTKANREHPFGNESLHMSALVCSV
jgi:hypothetical protein